MHYCIITTLCDLSKTNHCCEFWENKSKPFELNVWDCFSQAMPDSIILHKIWHSNSVVPKYWIIFYYYLYGVCYVISWAVGVTNVYPVQSSVKEYPINDAFIHSIEITWSFCFDFLFFPRLSDFIPLHDACTSCLFGFAHEYDSLICCPLFHLQLLTLTQRERR